MPHQSPWKRKTATPYSQYDTLENINKTLSEHSKIHNVHFIQTKLPSTQKVKKCWKENVLSDRNKRTWKMTAPGNHETSCRQWSTIHKPVVDSSHSTLSHSAGRKPCSSSFKRYDSKDCLPNKPHCPQKVMITRKIDKVKRSPHSKIHHLFRRNETPPASKEIVIPLQKMPLFLSVVRDARLWTDRNTRTWKMTFPGNHETSCRQWGTIRKPVVDSSQSTLSHSAEQKPG